MIEVPLVVYKDGERHVVGKASVSPNGVVVAELHPEISQEFIEMILGYDLFDVSIRDDSS